MNTYNQQPMDTSKWDVNYDETVTPKSWEENGSIYFAKAGGIEVQYSPEEARRLLFTDVEVRSAKMPFNAQSLRQITEVVTILRDEFNTYVNDTAGLHVHVGDDTQPFTLESIKNLCMLVTCFERQFNTLHPAHRLTNEMCCMISAAVSRAAHNAGRPYTRRFTVRGDPIFMANFIENYGDMQTLVDELNMDEDGFPTPHFVLSVRNLTLANRPHTVEFRQHRGTLDTEEVCRWVRLVATLVGESCQMDNPFRWLIENDIANFELNMLDLLVLLNLEPLAMLYSGYLYQHPPTPYPETESETESDDEDGDEMDMT